MDLIELRKEIDRIDFEILKLLNRRMEMALTSRKFKTAVLDEHREKQVLSTAEDFAHGLVTSEFSRALFTNVMAESRRLQELNLPLAGFQGEHGANSEMAALKSFPDAVPVPFESFDEIFEGVVAGYLDFGIVPVENSLGGMISQVNELMAAGRVYVVGESFLPIHHHLLALPETDYRDVRVVLSHPQALAQCRDFLKRHRLEAKPYYDTAGAARMLFQDRPEATAVIAGELCRKLYHLEAIKECIEDHPDNVTRFLLIAREPTTTTGNKCSIAFSTVHRAGALFGILEAFAEKGLNLTRIESVPMGSRPGNYVFFLDFLGNEADEDVKAVLERIESDTTMFHFLGCYEQGDLS